MGTEHALVVVGGHFELPGERNLVVAVDAVHDGIVDAYAAIHVAVKAHLVEVGHAEQLALWLRGVDDGAEQVEARGERQSLAYGADKLHGLGKQLGVQVDDAALVDGAVQTVQIVGEGHAVVGYHVGRSAGACGRVVAVLGHFVACSGYHEARRGGYVERVFAVAPGAYHVDVAVAVERHGHSRLQYAVAEAQQFVNGYAAHLQCGEQGGYLFLWIFAARDAHKYVFCLLACEFLMVEHAVEYVIHLYHSVKAFVLVLFMKVAPLELQKVVHNGSSVGREHALGVELYAVDVKIFMPQSHYLSLVA